MNVAKPKSIIPNFLLMVGPQDGPHSLEGFYTEETGPNSLMEAVERAEGRGEFCYAFALETPHYITAEPEEETSPQQPES